ncbi:MAG: hypothetical protein H0X02_03070, partial [Nitrosomonas sp.]|nr:hypothetical protein [Nitrosomonas sp.]
MDLKWFLPVPQNAAGLDIGLLYLNADRYHNVVSAAAWKIYFYLNLTGISGRDYAVLLL